MKPRLGDIHREADSHSHDYYAKAHFHAQAAEVALQRGGPGVTGGAVHACLAVYYELLRASLPMPKKEGQP